MWLAATFSTPVLLLLFPPTAVAPTAGWTVGWAWAAFHAVVLAVVSRRRTTGVGLLYAAGLVDIALLAVVQWLAGGWSTPYHLFVFVNVYAIAVSQPAIRTALATPLALLATFAPVAYGGTDGRVGDVVVAAGLWGILCWLATDVTSVVARQRRQLERAATHDLLTGLGNRRAFAAHVEGLLEHARSDGGAALVGIGDLDLFKDVNDRHGHLAGDECLRATARALVDACRAEDRGAVAYRWGGDEFVVVLALARPQDAEAVSGRISERLAVIETPAADVPGVGLTFGWCLWDGHATGERAVELADRQLIGRKTERRGAARRPATPPLDVGTAPA